MNAKVNACAYETPRSLIKLELACELPTLLHGLAPCSIKHLNSVSSERTHPPGTVLFDVAIFGSADLTSSFKVIR
jgi:hypothetical protein